MARQTVNIELRADYDLTLREIVLRLKKEKEAANA
jgi:hypothetical protein